jgi:hypothetical protein
VEYDVMVVRDNELPGGNRWVIARTGSAVRLIITESAYAAPGGLGVVWLAWVTCGGFAAPDLVAV